MRPLPEPLNTDRTPSLMLRIVAPTAPGACGEMLAKHLVADQLDDHSFLALPGDIPMLACTPDEVLC